MSEWQHLQDRLQVQFNEPRLLKRALTHRSYLNEHADPDGDNERLEFLGDAVIDLVVTDMLFRQYPQMDEGQLTRLRASLVRADALADIAHQFDMGAVLRLGKGERKNGGHTRPSLLSATFEAVVGAMYLDQGLGTVSDFLVPLMTPLAEITLEEHADVDAKSLFQEWAQANTAFTPRYETVAVEGPDHLRWFTVTVMLGDEDWGTGGGRSKQLAAQSAARAALKRAGQVLAEP